jgi:hypothetical protein
MGQRLNLESFHQVIFFWGHIPHNEGLINKNTIDNINGKRNDFLFGIYPYLKYRFII